MDSPPFNGLAPSRGRQPRLPRLASFCVAVAVLLLVPAAPASADVFGDLGAGFSGPSISSDKADYLPGEHVVLSGSGWMPGEHVHITVNDDIGQTWVRESDVTADDGGSITDEFDLPDSFIARYAVTATGDASGVARTSFTDGNVKVASANGRDFNFTWSLYTNATCSEPGGTPQNGVADDNGFTVGVGSNQSILLTANPTANSPNESSTFSNWTRPGTTPVQFAAGYTATDRIVCVVGFQSGNRDLIGNYNADGVAPLVTAINRADGNPTNTTGNVSWNVTFSESVTGVTAADFTLVNTGLGGTPAITSVTGGGASYTVSAGTGTGSGTLQLNLTDDDSIADAAGNKLNGTGLGNGNFSGQAYTIDRSAPVIAATAVTLPDNSPYTANTWINKSVRVTFACTDSGGSGKATDTASGNTDVTAETSASGTTVNSSGTCTDNAGNVAAGASFGPVKIDKTAPTITDLGPTTSANAAGWYNADVVNRFRASDSLSGLSSTCQTAFPDPVVDGRRQSKTTSGEGTAVTVGSDSCADEAGNTAAAMTSAAFKVDKTAPVLTDLGPTTSANAAGWYNANVVNEFKARDSLSGPDAACETAFPTVLADGRKQSKTASAEGMAVTVSSDPCTDAAGNTAAAISSAAFKIDKTAPTITDLGPTSSPNGAGWYDHDVVNEFRANDALSGPNSACETAFPDVVPEGRKQSKTTSGEGTAVTVDSDPCTDVAGNTAAAVTSAEFQIDKSDPQSAADSPDATNQSPFTVEYTASDQAGLSGLTKVELYVRTPEVGTGYALADTDTTPTASGESFTYTPTAGEGTYRFYTVAYDAAGNVETSPVSYDTTTEVETGTPDSETIYDITAPVTTDDSDGNWHNSAVTVLLSATDAAGGSGVDRTFYKVDSAPSFTAGPSVVIGAPSDHSNDGVHTIYYYSTDKAGNKELTKTATVKIDTVAPSVTYTSAAPDANAHGWRNVDVTATFTATDTLSGFAGPSSTKTGTSTTSGEGSGVTVGSPAFTDLAGNIAAAGAATSPGFKIDKTAPSLSPAVTPNPVLLNGSAVVNSNASDALSDIATQSCGTLNTSTPGNKSVSCSATDKAGNSNSATASYTVQYGWNGFLQPINDTAHQTGLTQSRFKLGSTVPAKFVLRDAAGLVVRQATNPTFSRTNRLRACDSNATAEPTTGDLNPDGGASYVWDGAQYHYNWSTKSIKDVGVYRIYANLADGAQRWVDICLW